MPARLLTLGIIDGAGTGASIAAISILITLGSGPGAAAAVLAAGAAGRMLALAWTTRLARKDVTAQAARNAYTVATLLMTFGSIAAVTAAQQQMLLTAAALGIASGTGNNLTSTLAATARKGSITAFYPLLMIGGAAGATWATHIIQTGRPLLHIQALLALQLAEPALIRPYQAALRESPPLANIATSALKSATLSTFAYGPLTIYAVLVTMATGPEHVGAAMAAYAAGASIAATCDRMLIRNQTYAEDGWKLTAALAAAGAATWIAAGTLPGMLAGRAASGLLMFLAQGRLLRRSHQEGGEAQVAGTSAGLGIGGGIGGVLAGTLAGSVGVGSMALLLATATLALAAIGRRGR